MQGQTQAQLDSVFTDRLNALQTDADGQAQAYTGGPARPWQVPDEIKSLFDIANLHTPAYDRDDLNGLYQQIMGAGSNPGTTADVIAIKTQIDYVASEERAFRTRHTSLCRALAHAHGRRNGHGNGPVFALTQRQTSTTLAAGGQAGGTGGGG